MDRRDTHLDAMLRHLGAAYYDSLHGRAAPADVTRAVDSVAERVGEPPAGKVATSGYAGGQPARSTLPQHHGRWHSRVRDVMTTSVVTVDRITPYKEIVHQLTEHQVSGLPVLTLGRHVAGIVSEGDLVAEQDRHSAAHAGHRGPWHRPGSGRPHQDMTAEQLMTSPAVTIHPDATLSAAARVMTARHIRRLPVVDPDGKLIGIVSRRDLLSVFLRPDAEIARQVGELLTEVLPAGPEAIKVTVHQGVVTLTRKPGVPTDGEDLARLVVRLARDIDGVVSVVDKTSAIPPQASAAS